MKSTILFTPVFLTPLLGAALAGCETPSGEAEEASLAEELPRVDVVLGGEFADVSISDEEFEALVEEYGLQDERVPEGADGGVTPRLSNWCSIPSSVTNSTASWTVSAAKAPSCYGYAYFGNDNEADCYIKFPSYVKTSQYRFVDLNACAAAATTYYLFNLAAYYDSGANVYLRMDRKWCEQMNCEDGFKIKY